MSDAITSFKSPLVARSRNWYYKTIHPKIKIIRKAWFSISLMLISVLVLGFFILSYQYAFNYQILFNESYKLLFICGIIIILLLLCCLFQGRKSVTDTFLYFFLAGFLLFVHQNPNQEFLFIVLFGCVLFAAYRKIRLKYFRYISLILLIFFLGNTLCCFFFILNDGVIQGIINNSGIMAIYTAIHLPVLYFLLNKFQANPKLLKVIELPKLLSLFIICAFIVMVVVIILKSQSRAALVVASLLTFLYVVRNYSFRLKPTLLLIAGGILLLIPTLYFFTQSVGKQTSLDGRLLMSRIALSHLTDNLWLGTGLGRFTWYYPQWQAAYFKSVPDYEKYYLIKGVGESYNILNEHLQLVLSVGIFGTIAIAYGLWVFFNTRSSRYPDLLFLFKCVVTGIIIAGFMSYPFHVNIIVFLLIFCFSFALKINERKFFYIKYFTQSSRVSALVIASSMLMLSATTYVTIKCGQKINAVMNWHEMKYSYAPFLIQKQAYHRFYPYLKTDGKYLTDYGRFVLQNRREMTNHDLDSAIEILEEAKTIAISKDQMEALAYAYWMKKDYRNAISCFEWLNDFLPYLFEPKLALMKIYIEMRNFDHAGRIGRVIIQMPPKVQSDEVSKIKMEAKNLFTRHNLNSAD